MFIGNIYSISGAQTRIPTLFPKSAFSLFSSSSLFTGQPAWTLLLKQRQRIYEPKKICKLITIHTHNTGKWSTVFHEQVDFTITSSLARNILTKRKFDQFKRRFIEFYRLKLSFLRFCFSFLLCFFMRFFVFCTLFIKVKRLLSWVMLLKISENKLKRT